MNITTECLTEADKPNPIILDSSGRTFSIWLNHDADYNFPLTSANLAKARKQEPVISPVSDYSGAGKGQPTYANLRNCSL